MITTLIAVAIGLACAAPAMAIPDIYEPQWGIGGSGFTHRNAMAKAMQIASDRGAGWVDSIAIDRAIYPDTVFKDNIDHNYNHFGGDRSYYNSSWGSDFGNPQGKVQMYYNAAVASLRAGDRVGASKNIGYMSHYLIDINGPLHTEESNAYEGNTVHTNLEQSAADVSGSTMSSYIHPEAFQYYGGQGSPSALTVANAHSSHAYYSDLVHTYHSSGFNGHVRDIEGLNFNRGVNSIADLIQSAARDADSVVPVIDSVSPSSATTGQVVSFAGHGADGMGHTIEETRWRSDVDGPLSTAPSFTYSFNTVGIRNIFFIVRCSGPQWSNEIATPFVVGAENTKPQGVYRFYNRQTGVHLYTTDEAERATVQNTLSSLYSLEGIAYALDTSSTANNAPLYRFYDFKRGVHFYTASEDEKNTVLTTLGGTYSYDGPSYNVSLTPVAGTQPVWRFYNVTKGVHFYTSDINERDSVIHNLGHIYRYEGESYYFDPPW
jgi:hypothetical protein